MFGLGRREQDASKRGGGLRGVREQGASIAGTVKIYASRREQGKCTRAGEISGSMSGRESVRSGRLSLDFLAPLDDPAFSRIVVESLQKAAPNPTHRPNVARQDFGFGEGIPPA